MIEFLVGAVMGAAFASCGFVLIGGRRKEKDPVVWTDEHYQPPVVTRIVNKRRSIEL